MKTGDQLTLEFGSTGLHSRVLANGEPLENVAAMRLETEASGYTTLTLELVELPAGGWGQHRRTFCGYFVSEEDMEAFEEWQRRRRIEQTVAYATSGGGVRSPACRPKT